jgi:hypothetical protein
MLPMLFLLLQEELPPTWIDNVREFVDTPAPYSPFSEYLLVLFLLWLLARRQRPKPDFGGQAQSVLEEKFKKGEIDKKTYEKYRQELSMRLKKE